VIQSSGERRDWILDGTEVREQAGEIAVTKVRVVVELEEDIAKKIEDLAQGCGLPRMTAILAKFGYDILVAIQRTGLRVEPSSKRSAGASGDAV
jgi:hypothetical protein